VRDVIDPEAVGTQVFTADAWTRPALRTELFADATTGTLQLIEPTESGSATIGTTASALIAHVGARNVEFTSAPLTEDTVFVGLPQMQLNAAVSTGEIIHLTATLFREDAEGNREPMNFCAIQPQLRHGVHTVAPVVPGEEMPLPLQCFTMAHWVPAGQHLVLEVATRTPHHASFGSDPEITIFTGPDRTSYLLPVVPDASLHDDVPLREQR
jgi:hypothetical protein